MIVREFHNVTELELVASPMMPLSKIPVKKKNLQSEMRARSEKKVGQEIRNDRTGGEREDEREDRKLVKHRLREAVNE